MKISIITPSFNSGRYILETMKSIHTQSCKDFEHIVIDGLSSDDTLEIVGQFENVHLISEKDNGQSDAINKGFQKCTGDIIAWQNADDIYSPKAFETVVKFFQLNPAVDVVYGHYQLIDSESKWICNVYPIEWNSWMFAHGRFCPMQPTVFWRRRVFESVGFLNEKLHYCMDVDFFSRMVNNGFVFKLIPEILGQFRVHSQSKTQNSNNEKIVLNEYRAVLKTNFKFTLTDDLFFEFFQLRSQLAKTVKINLLKKV